MALGLPVASLIVVFAGVRCRESLIGQLRQCDPVLEIPMEGLPIGKQLQWLRVQVGRTAHHPRVCS